MHTLRLLQLISLSPVWRSETVCTALGPGYGDSKHDEANDCIAEQS